MPIKVCDGCGAEHGAPFHVEPKVTEDDLDVAGNVLGEMGRCGCNDDLWVSDRQKIAEALSSERHRIQEKYKRLYEAAKGLSHGTDWNNGTHAKLHGYRQNLLDALSDLERQ